MAVRDVPDGPGSGPLLDLERELAQILSAVEPARRHAAAYVRILDQGTLAAIEEALPATPHPARNLVRMLDDYEAKDAQT
jgi:hypothetical protein